MSTFEITDAGIAALVNEVWNSRCFAAGRNLAIGKKCYRPKNHTGKHRYY